MLITARHSLGLATRLNTSKLGGHSFLPENAVDRVRKLAGSFIEGAQSRLGIKVGSDRALWTWAARHASWAPRLYAKCQQRRSSMASMLAFWKS